MNKKRKIILISALFVIGRAYLIGFTISLFLACQQYSGTVAIRGKLITGIYGAFLFWPIFFNSLCQSYFGWDGITLFILAWSTLFVTSFFIVGWGIYRFNKKMTRIGLEFLTGLWLLAVLLLILLSNVTK